MNNATRLSRSTLRKVALISHLLPLFLYGIVIAEKPTRDCTEATRLVKQAVKRADDSQREEELYTKAIKLCDELAEAHYNLGVLYDKKEKLGKAKESFQKAYERKQDLQFKVALAQVEMKLGESEQAKADYEAILNEDDTYIPALIGLSIVLEGSGDLRSALKMLMRAAEIAPMNTEVLYNLAVVYDKSGQTDEAASTYLKLLEKSPDHFQALYYVGLLYERTKRYERSKSYLLRALDVKPEALEAHRVLAFVLQQIGDLDRAELSLRKAIALDSEDVDTRVNLAVILLAKEQESLAEQVLDEALRLDKVHERALSLLGVAQYRLGKYTAATKTFHRVFDLNPQNATAKAHIDVLTEGDKKASQ